MSSTKQRRWKARVIKYLSTIWQIDICRRQSHPVLNIRININLRQTQHVLFPFVTDSNCHLYDDKIKNYEIETSVQTRNPTSMHITDVTWAPMFTTHAVDNPLPNAAARPSWKINWFKFNIMRKNLSIFGRKI